MTGDHTVTDSRDDLPFMVHSDLDDLDLTPFEFRAYAHMVRRAGIKGGEYWESVDAGAKHCRMDAKTYRAALRSLVRRGLLTRTDRPGETSVYRITPRRSWLTPTKSGRATESGTPTENGRGTPTKSGRTPLPKTVDKVLPLKRIPGRESQEIRARPKPAPKKRKGHEFNPAEAAQDLPPNFDRELFQDFCARRLENNAPMTLLALKQFVTKHKRHPPDVLDEMFRSAIIGGWKDLYPPRDHKPSGSPEERAANNATNLLAHLERRTGS